MSEVSLMDKYKRHCLGCDKDYFINPHYGVNYPGKYCSHKCYSDKRKGVRISPETEFKRIYELVEVKCACGNLINTSRLHDNRGKYCSKSCQYKFGMAKDQKHHGWKGSEVGYSALHSWIARKLGKPNECSNCGFTSDNSRQFNWANLSHEYKRDLDDWARLCGSCHRKYDMGSIELCVLV